MSEPAKADLCPTCGNRRTVKVLGGGGDYEDWPCPTCEAATQRDAAIQRLSENDDEIMALRSSLDAANRACAEMRDCLSRAIQDGRVTQLAEWQYRSNHAISTDCGKYYVPKAELDAATDKLAEATIRLKDRQGKEAVRILELEEGLRKSGREYDALKAQVKPMLEALETVAGTPVDLFIGHAPGCYFHCREVLAHAKELGL